MSERAESVAQVPEPAVVHNCPSCSHWLPAGTLACPDCRTLAYGPHLSAIAFSAQQLEQQQKWAEAKERWASALTWLPNDAKQTADVQAHMAQIDARVQAEGDKRARWTKRLGPLAPVLFFLLKAKSALFLLFKIKFLFSLFAFFGIYWALFGWKFALGFTVCLFIHEMGHYVSVKRRGLKADLPIFLPGMGAYVRWYAEGVSREEIAAVALAGPLYGLTAALACVAIYWATRMDIFLVLANVGAWINFFNLLPVLGLDGAHATYALSRLQRALLAATCLLFFGLSVSGGEIFGPTTQWIFLIVGAGMVWRCFTPDEPEEPSTKTFLYFQGLILVLGVLLYRTQFAGLR